jgi:hypothetical protein
MTTPNRGRGRGPGDYGRGRGRGRNNMLPYQELNIPLIGDWTTVSYNRGRQSSTPQKKEVGSSLKTSDKIISYKEATNEPSAQEQILEYLENHVTETIFHIEDEDVEMANKDGWAIKTRYLESRWYPGLFGKSRPHLEILLTVTESVTITHNYQNNNPENFINFNNVILKRMRFKPEWRKGN